MLAFQAEFNQDLKLSVISDPETNSSSLTVEGTIKLTDRCLESLGIYTVWGAVMLCMCLCDMGVFSTVLMRQTPENKFCGSCVLIILPPQSPSAALRCCPDIPQCGRQRGQTTRLTLVTVRR